MRTQPLGPSEGAPYGATILVRGVPKRTRSPIRMRPLGPSAKLPIGPQSSRGACRNRHGHARERGHWGLRWSSLWGLDPREGCATWGSMRGGDACERNHWGRRWSFLWGYDPREGCARWGSARLASAGAGAARWASPLRGSSEDGDRFRSTDRGGSPDSRLPLFARPAQLQPGQRTLPLRRCAPLTCLARGAAAGRPAYAGACG